MSIQPWVHVETLEEYSERFKDFAHLERTEDGILLCQLTWKGGPVMWSYQTQHAYGELWTAIGHDKKNEVMILAGPRERSHLLRRDRERHRPGRQVQRQHPRHHELR